MAERTAEEVAQIFSAAGDSVAEINKAKKSGETDDDYKDRMKRNVQHLEVIKTYKKEDITWKHNNKLQHISIKTRKETMFYNFQLDWEIYLVFKEQEQVDLELQEGLAYRV